MQLSNPDAPFADVWYRIDLSADDYDGGEADVIESAFRQIYLVHNAPLGMAMLGGRPEVGSGYCVYFTPHSLPHARSLVLAYSALPSAAPPRERLALRVGDASLAMGDVRQF